MNNLHVSARVTIDPPCVVFQRLGHSDSASYRTALSYLLLHVFFSANSSKFFDTVCEISIRYIARISRSTITTEFHGRALSSIVESACHIDRASFVGDLIRSHPLEGIVGFAPVTARVFRFAREEHLRGKVDVGPGCLASYLYSVGEG